MCAEKEEGYRAKAEERTSSIGPLLNFEWVDSVVFELAAGVKGGRSPAKRTLDAGCQPVRWLSWPMRHADASAMTSRSVSYA